MCVAHFPQASLPLHYFLPQLDAVRYVELIMKKSGFFVVGGKISTYIIGVGPTLLRNSSQPFNHSYTHHLQRNNEHQKTDRQPSSGGHKWEKSVEILQSI